MGQFTLVPWRVQKKLYNFLEVLKFPPKESFSTKQFFQKENEESFEAFSLLKWYLQILIN